MELLHLAHPHLSLQVIPDRKGYRDQHRVPIVGMRFRALQLSCYSLGFNMFSGFGLISHMHTKADRTKLKSEGAWAFEFRAWCQVLGLLVAPYVDAYAREIDPLHRILKHLVQRTWILQSTCSNWWGEPSRLRRAFFCRLFGPI